MSEDNVTDVDVAEVPLHDHDSIQGDDEMPANARPDSIDAQVDQMMQHGLAGQAEQFRQTAARFNDGSGFAAQESKQTFLNMGQLVMTQNANNLEKHGLVDSGQQMNYERRRGGSQTDVNE